jgi:uncharacterized membrane protein
MQMKSWIKWIVATVIVAVIVHLVVVKIYPNIIMGAVMKKLEKVYQGNNKLIHAPQTTDKSRNVVRPSPDLLYSACVYDVSEYPIRITAKVPETYWSISFYRTNTDNFFVKNDRQVKSRDVAFILVSKGKSVPDAGGAEVIEAPTDKGFFIIRMLVKDEARINDLIEVQKQATCSPVE